MSVVGPTGDADDRRVPLSRPRFGPEELEAVAHTLESGWVAGQGPEGERLESATRDLTGAAHAVAVSNCTAGLYLVLRGWGVGEGDEVLVADYTYPATAMAVLLAGARPVPVDVQLATGEIDVDAARSLVGSRTRALVAVDPLGLPADWTAIEKAFEGSGMRLLTDAACSLGGAVDGRPAGTTGDAGVFSLHARKGVTSGEGGLVVTDDPLLAERVRAGSAFGVTRAATSGAVGLSTAEFARFGFNFKLSDILAAVGRVQLGRLPDALAHRRACARAYADLLAGLPLRVPHVPHGREHTWQTYAVTLDEDVDREQVMAHLRSEGIGCAIGTYALSAQPLFEESAGTCPVSVSLFRRQLALPMYDGLTAAQQERVADVLGEALDRAQK